MTGRDGCLGVADRSEGGVVFVLGNYVLSKVALGQKLLAGDSASGRFSPPALSIMGGASAVLLLAVDFANR